MALNRHRRLAERYIATFAPPVETKDSGSGNGDGSKPTSSTSPSSNPATSLAISVPVSSTSSANPVPTTSSSTSSAVATTSSSTSSTSSAAATTSAGPAVVTVHSTATFSTPQTSFTLITGSIGSVSTATPSATGTPASSSSGSINVTAVVGGIAATLVGLAAVVFLVMWLMRRRNKDDDEDFNASIFRRQSAILQDDAVSFNPRPPTMIERHVTNASPALAAQRGVNSGGQNFYGGYGSFGPGEIVQPAYGQPVMGYGESGQLARQPSNAAFLTRQPTAAGRGATLSPGDNDPHYVDLNRSSVTPFQAAQYADISRRLNAMDNPRGSDDLHRAPLPSPFDDHPEEVAPTHNTPAPAAQAPAPRERQPTSDAQRPASAYSAYEDGDAYGGI